MSCADRRALGVTSSDVVVNVSRASRRATRPHAHCRTRRKVARATGGSAMSCAAACGREENHNVARRRCHALNVLSRVSGLLCMQQARYKVGPPDGRAPKLHR